MMWLSLLADFYMCEGLHVCLHSCIVWIDGLLKCLRDHSLFALME